MVDTHKGTKYFIFVHHVFNPHSLIIQALIDVKFAPGVKNEHFVFYPYTRVSTVYSVLTGFVLSYCKSCVNWGGLHKELRTSYLS